MPITVAGSSAVAPPVQALSKVCHKCGRSLPRSAFSPTAWRRPSPICHEDWAAYLRDLRRRTRLRAIRELVDAGDARELLHYQLDMLRRAPEVMADMFVSGTADERVERIELLARLVEITQRVVYDCELHEAAQEQLRRLSASE